jgi:hypothetical protein
MTDIGWVTELDGTISGMKAVIKSMDRAVTEMDRMSVVLVKQAITIRELSDYRDELESRLLIAERMLVQSDYASAHEVKRRIEAEYEKGRAS